MFKSMMQAVVKNSVLAAEIYIRAFGAKLLCGYKSAEGYYEHAELDVFGQVLALTELIGGTPDSGNTMMFCLHFGEDKKACVIKAFEVLKEQAVIESAPSPCSYSSCQAVLTDKFGIRWCLIA